ncbi:rhomboid family intramembrane serine protease [Flavobacterium sp. GCM10027622]|uniref:rhomboid family intramembrane serine protease n=1 Tax=unclassified Flavobacterium TaxID=196869 RepID=UPI003619E9EF
MIPMSPTVKQLLIINIIFFVGTWLIGDLAYVHLGLVPFQNEAFRPWQLVTNMFMHFDIRHIAFNMLALYSFGSALEYIWGAKKFLFFYISCGLGAGLLQNGIFYMNGIDVALVLGASGAVYGLMTAFAFMFPESRMGLMLIPVSIKAKYFVPIVLSIDYLLGFYGSSFFSRSTGVAHFAHLGGALIGFIMMWYWKKNSFNNRRWN